MFTQYRVKANAEEIDVLVKAQVKRADIQMLAKLVEGLGHLGVVTTTDKSQGIVVFQTTKDCWPELKMNLINMPLEIIFMEENF